MEATKPLYTHDCDKCIFLGTMETDDVQVDLYFCDKQGPNLLTVLSRYGNEGPEYTSGLSAGRDGLVPALSEAYKRAVERGLLPGEAKFVEPNLTDDEIVELWQRMVGRRVQVTHEGEGMDECWTFESTPFGGWGIMRVETETKSVAPMKVIGFQPYTTVSYVGNRDEPPEWDVADLSDVKLSLSDALVAGLAAVWEARLSEVMGNYLTWRSLAREGRSTVEP